MRPPASSWKHFNVKDVTPNKKSAECKYCGKFYGNALASRLTTHLAQECKLFPRSVEREVTIPNTLQRKRQRPECLSEEGDESVDDVQPVDETPRKRPSK